MFEFRHEPSANRIMRHQAWQTNGQALARAKTLNAKTGKNPVYALSTALQLLGRQTPQSFALPSNVLHTVFPTPRDVRRTGDAMRHTWRPLETLGSIVTVDGVRCTSPAATFAQLGAYCSLEDLVAIGDSLTCRDAMLRRAEVEQLQRFVDRAGQFFGKANVSRALRLIRSRTDSPAETRMRLMAMQYGLPCPQTDVVIAKEPLEIRLDAGWPEYRIGMEYQGKHHREQYENDLIRGNGILRTGWIAFQFTHGMLTDPALAYMMFEAVAAALHAAGAPIEHARSEPLSLRKVSDRPAGRPPRGA